MDGHTVVLRISDDAKIQIWGFRTNLLKTTLSVIGYILTLGFFRLLLHWQPKWHVSCTKDRCHLSEADTILVCDEHHIWTLRSMRVAEPGVGEQISLPCAGGDFLDVSELRFFTYRKLKYVWHPRVKKFTSVHSLDHEVPISRYHDWARSGEGLTDAEFARRLFVYGRNLIEVKLKPILVLLFKEAITPFYVFQVFSVTVWYNDNYVYYASVIVLMSVMSITVDVYQIRSQEKNLRDMVHSTDVIDVVRSGKVVALSSDQLVPGDLVHIPPHGCTLQCDAVLLNGTCIVNESMLTGESVPVTKVALPETDLTEEVDGAGPIYTNTEHAKHTLYCGTQVLQTRFYSGQPVQAIVIRTGYATLKGQLVRSIMYPKPVDFRFTKDLFKFVGVLAVIAAMGLAYSITVMIVNGSDVKKVILRSLDIITIVVPPALPAAMTIGIFAAQMRLKKRKIYCISPSTINTCGGINTVCFDKTGTLTEDGLDFNCAIPVYRKGSTSTDSSRPAKFGEETTEFRMDELPYEGELVKAVAACHSLTRIGGELCGDPLDMILFRQTGWVLDEPNVVEETGRFDSMVPTLVRSPGDHFGQEAPIELGIVRQFTFSSNLQRMSVFVRRLGESDMTLYCKGAPEKIASLCLDETIPTDFYDVVNKYAQRGYRLIAIARRSLQMSFVKAQRVSRESVECDLELLGVVMLENRLKPQTVGVIHQLKRANIRPIMVTGDNLLTAMSVARECGLLDCRKKAYIVELGDALGRDGPRLVLQEEVSSAEENGVNGSTPGELDMEFGKVVDSAYQVAVAGTTFGVIFHQYPELLDKLVCVCDVYARMSPDQKQMLVNHLQTVDYTVAMCGDGANDCGALKAAHAGISLSEAEASIAAPFTSQIADIRCVPIVIREGRAALVTSFGVFKYMAGYSLTQFTTVLLLYWLATNLTDFQFLYIDLFLITVFAVFFGYTDAAEQLCPKPPPIRLLSMSSVASIIGILAINGLFQGFTFVFVTTQPWFVPYSIPEGDDDETKVSMQGTAVFFVSIYQYITLAIVYSTGFPYRKPIFNNRLMCVSLVVLSTICVYITLNPPQFITNFLELDPIPYLGFRLFLLTIAVLSGVLCYLYETWVIDYLLGNVRERWQKQRRALNDSDSVKYERILRQIGGEPTWLRSFIDKMDAADRTPSPPENLLRANSVSPEDCCLIDSKQENMSNGHHRPSKDMTSSL